MLFMKCCHFEHIDVFLPCLTLGLIRSHFPNKNDGKISTTHFIGSNSILQTLHYGARTLYAYTNLDVFLFLFSTPSQKHFIVFLYIRNISRKFYKYSIEVWMWTIRISIEKWGKKVLKNLPGTIVWLNTLHALKQWLTSKFWDCR